GMGGEESRQLRRRHRLLDASAEGDQRLGRRGRDRHRRRRDEPQVPAPAQPRPDEPRRDGDLRLQHPPGLRAGGGRQVHRQADPLDRRRAGKEGRPLRSGLQGHRRRSNPAAQSENEARLPALRASCGAPRRARQVLPRARRRGEDPLSGSALPAESARPSWPQAGPLSGDRSPRKRVHHLPGRPAPGRRRAGLRHRNRPQFLRGEEMSAATALKVPFIDLKQRYEEEKTELLACVERVVSQGHFVLTQEVSEFEQAAARYIGVKHFVAFTSGTDALMMALWAHGIGKGDEVITTPVSFVATTGSIVHVGAKPVYVDVREDQLIDPAKIEAAITPRTKAIMPVHWIGRIADMDAIMAVAKKHKLLVIEDAAQTMGAYYKGKHGGSHGNAAGYSAHPLKNLNALGDGGF